jgi:3-oxoacyl-[acyl-carrier-protein] synthase-3/clorobiocin biosynthesis protein CloN2
MRVTDTYISGLGVYLPETVTVEDAVAQGLYPEADAIANQLIGVAIAGDTPAPEMALRAAQDAFKRSGENPEEISLLLYADAWHQGPDGWQPQYYLQRHLVGGDVLSVEVRQGCNGMFSALELAASYLAARQDRQTALAVAADNFGTPLVNRWRTGPGFIVGDGASAVLLSKKPSFAQLRSVRSVAIPELEELHRIGQPLFPPAATTGLTMSLADRADAFKRWATTQPEIMDAWLKLYRRMLEVINPTLEEAGITIKDVTRVAFPNSGKDVVEQRWTAALGMTLAQSTWEFGRTIGHISASDQIIALDHLLTTGELNPGDHYLMVGIGPGITLSSAVISINQRPSWLL